MSKIRAPKASTLSDLKLDSPAAVLEKIKAVVKDHQAPPLYSRPWQQYSSSVGNSSSNAFHFRVMQFNILAEGLSALPDVKPPFEDNIDGSPIKPSSCGGFDGGDSEEANVIFNFHGFRKWRLVEEILRVEPDILAVEEIDHFSDFFQPILGAFGYSGIFQSKSASPSNSFGYYSDGVALFWKNDKFTLIDDQTASDNQSCPFIVAPLRVNANEKVIVCSTTHLKAKPSLENEMKRDVQIEGVLDSMNRCFTSVGGDAMVLLGDFNTDPYSSDSATAIVIPRVLKWNDACLSHAYPLPTDTLCGSYTTWKSRSGKIAKHVIDYIFYTHSSLRVTATLGPPAPDEIAQSELKLPNIRYPSDHISVAADLTLQA